MTPDVLPLAGRCVVVTRAEHQSRSVRAALEWLGARVMHLPTIEIEPIDRNAIVSLIERVPDYDWLVFTSANAVDALLTEVSDDRHELQGVRVAAVGTSTRKRLDDAGVHVDLIPSTFMADALVEALVDGGVIGQRVVVPASDIARDTLAVGLREAGALVDVVTVYRTIRPRNADPAVIEALRTGTVDLIVFASPSAVRNAIALLGGTLPPDVPIATIGPVTSSQVRQSGMRVAVEALEHSESGLVTAIREYWSPSGKHEVPDGSLDGS